MTEKLCDACGARAVPFQFDPKQWHHDADANLGPVLLCAKHWDKLSEDDYAKLKARRTAAQSPAEVDPRTLPVGAVFSHVGYPGAQYRVTQPGRCQRVMPTVSGEMDIGSAKAIVISLPEPAQEVELGSLAVGEWFEFSKNESDLSLADRVPQRVARPSSLPGETVTHIGYCYFSARLVLRVPAPSSAVEPPVKFKSLLSEFANVEPNCFACGAACESRCAVPVDGQHYGICEGCRALNDTGHKAEIADAIRERLSKPKPAPRWPNTPESEWPRLDAILHKQIASGGQNCPAARSLIERADRLRREVEERESSAARGHDLERYRNKGGPFESWHRGGIDCLKLERPLISWKRRK